MKVSILVQEGPYNHQASDSAYNFAVAVLAKGHSIRGIFFYHDGVYNASKLIDPPEGDRVIPRRWSEFAKIRIDLKICVASAKRRGIEIDLLESGFEISGLGQLASMIAESDRIVTFGD